MDYHKEGQQSLKENADDYEEEDDVGIEEGEAAVARNDEVDSLITLRGQKETDCPSVTCRY